ncbi:hypothetical protein YPPY32_1020, partial [Yersinia pestis PY-32]
MVGASPP